MDDALIDQITAIVTICVHLLVFSNLDDKITAYTKRIIMYIEGTHLYNKITTPIPKFIKSIISFIFKIVKFSFKIVIFILKAIYMIICVYIMYDAIWVECLAKIEPFMIFWHTADERYVMLVAFFINITVFHYIFGDIFIVRARRRFF